MNLEYGIRYKEIGPKDCDDSSVMTHLINLVNWTWVALEPINSLFERFDRSNQPWTWNIWTTRLSLWHGLNINMIHTVWRIFVCIGVKLVRGAYIEGERQLAEKSNKESEVWSTKELTDKWWESGIVSFFRLKYYHIGQFITRISNVFTKNQIQFKKKIIPRQRWV